MQTDDAWRAVVELAASRHGVFHRDQAALHGMKNRRLARAVERGELHQPVPNVFTLASHRRSWKQGLMIHSAAGGAASHRAAAALLGLDGCRPGIVEVSLPRHAKPCAWGTHCDRSRKRSNDSGALDRPGQERSCAFCKTPNGAGALPDSWFERLLNDLLHLSNLPPPELQHEVATAAGPRRLDLAFPEVRLGIEAHSRRFHFGPGKQTKDDQRDLELAAMGWELVYVTWPMMTDRTQLISLIERVYRARSAPKPPIGSA